jgi:hypothetical protein
MQEESLRFMPVRFNQADICRFRMDGDIMHVTAVARHPGVLNYRQGNQVRGELVSPLFLRKLDSEGLPIIRHLAGIPTTNEHPAFLFKYRPDALEQLQTGKVGNDIHVFKDGATQVTFETWDSATQQLIRSGRQKGVSLGYEVDTIPTQGNWDGRPYQWEQSEPFYADHLATVRNPRAKGALIKHFDSEDDWACQICTDSSAWDLEQRQSLAQGRMVGAFAGPDLAYPIASKQDVADAWISSYRADAEEQVRSNILAIAKEYGWQDGLSPSAIDWAQQRDIPFRNTRRKVMAQVQFDGGLVVEVPESAASAIAALRSKLDSAMEENKTLKIDMADMKKKKEEEDEELQETYDSYLFEKARADALEADKEGRVDSEGIATEVVSRIDAYIDAVEILDPTLKVALDGLEITFDGTKSALDIQKDILKYLQPDLNLDDAEVPGAYKMAKLSAAPQQLRTDSTSSIVRRAVRSTGGSSPREKRAARMDAQQKRSRLSLAQQKEFDRAQVAG